MDKLESLLDRLEKVTVYLESIAPSDMNRSAFHTNSTVQSPNNLSLSVYDNLINGPVKEFTTLGSTIGGDVNEQCNLLLDCFRTQKRFLEMTMLHSKPTEKEFLKLAKPSWDAISAVEDFRDEKRNSIHFNHLSAVADSVVALKWIVMSPPAPFVKSMQEAAEFYTNRVIKDNKDSNPVHAAWAKALLSVWTHLIDFIKQHYPAGLTWRSVDVPSADGANRVPPPPPPRPLKLDQAVTKNPSGDPNSTGALFAQLNRGEAVTAGLRKVTDDMKTHKNPSLRTVPPLEPHSDSKKECKPEVKRSEPRDQGKTALMELQGSKWVVENFKNQELHITDTKPKHTVYIYKCEGCTVEIKGKINSIMLDDCKKTGVVFDHLISSLDVVNCQSVHVQSLGQLQTVNVDKTDSCQIYLSADSTTAGVITSKSSAINILIPKADGDFDEYPVPEQFKTVFNGKGLETVHHTGI